MDRSRRNLLIGGVLIGGLGLAGTHPSTCSRQERPQDSEMAENPPPKRPPGQPKPLLEEDIEPVLARLDAWYSAHLPQDQYVFNPPATEAEIVAFEQLVGFKLPNAYHQFYRWHDGDEGAPEIRGRHFFNYNFVPLEGAREIWKLKSEVLADFGGNRYPVPGAGWPVGAVDPAYLNPRWIPLTWNGTGNHIGLDFDPWPEGRVGQVIIFGRDEEVKVVIAESLGKFLEWIADLLEGGNFVLEEHGFRLKNPPVNSLHDGARILLGAPDPFLGLEYEFTYNLALRAARGELLGR